VTRDFLGTHSEGSSVTAVRITWGEFADVFEVAVAK